MTQEEYRDAIAKGMGRAVLAARDTGILYADAIVEACLQDRRFEPPRYESQAPYLHFIATQAGVERQVVDAILAALPNAPAGRDRTGMVDLLGLFARTGSQPAFDALLSLADTGDTRAQDALATSGDPGLEWAVEHILPRIPEDEQDFVWVWLINGGWDDRTPTRTRLRLIRQEAMARAKAEYKPRESRTTLPSAFLASPAVRDDATMSSPPGDFVTLATQEEFAQAAERLLIETDPQRLRALSEVFHMRRFPLEPERLFDLVDDPARSQAACVALGRLAHASVHGFGLNVIARPTILPHALRILRETAERRDLKAIMAYLKRVEDTPPEVRHAVAIEADEVARTKWKRPWQPLAEWVYEHAPNASGRSAGFDWIVRIGKLSPIMLEEARYDASDYARDQAEERSRKPAPAFLRFAARNVPEAQ